MKKYYVIAIVLGISGALYGQETASLQLAADTVFGALLNEPAMVKHPEATHLDKGWFKLETDAHVITDEVSVQQVAAVLLDVANQEKYFDGKKSKLTTKVAGQADNGGTIVDFVSTSIDGLIQIKAPYRAVVTTIENTSSKIAVEVRQTAEDSSANHEIKNLFATRYAETMTVDGKTYTYIRIYTLDEVNASILPAAKNILEKDAVPVNIETLYLIIAAAKTK